MRKVIAQEFLSLDGFAAGPNGEIDFLTDSSTGDPTGGPFVDDQLAFIESIDRILLGATTYRMFASFWPEQTTETQGIADALNATPKTVFSSTLDSAPWGPWEPARLVSGSAADEVRRLKAEDGRTWSCGAASSLSGRWRRKGSSTSTSSGCSRSCWARASRCSRPHPAR